jgi:hypothetical protein
MMAGILAALSPVILLAGVLVRERLWFRRTRRAIRALPETDRPEESGMARSLPPDEREGRFG